MSVWSWATHLNSTWSDHDNCCIWVVEMFDVVVWVESKMFSEYPVVPHEV